MSNPGTTGSNVHPFTRPAPSRAQRIGPWIFEAEACRLYRGEDEQRLTPKTAAVLDELAKAGGQVVTRETLFERVWQKTDVPSQDLLNHAIKELRRALGDDLKAPTFIETIPKVGYRLIAQTGVADAPSVRGAAAVIGFPQRREPREIEPARHPTMLWLVLVVLATLVVAVPLIVRRQAGTTAGGQPALQLRDVHYVTAEPGEEAWPRLSPDGGFIAYTAPVEGARRRLFVRAVDGTRPVRITHEVEGLPYHENYPVWSPDGANLAFLRVREDGDCRVHVISALGGVERAVHQCRAFMVDYFDWAPDGRRLVITRAVGDETGTGSTSGTDPTAISIVDLESGDTHTLPYGPRSSEHDLEPKVSPDGRWIAFRRGVAPFSDLWVMSIDGGAARRLTTLSAMVRGHDWMPDGKRIVFSSDHEGQQALYALEIASGDIEPLGEPGSFYPDVAPRRARLAFVRDQSDVHLVEFPVAPRTPKIGALLVSSASDYSGQYSPVDDRIAFMSTRSGQPALWLFDPVRDETRLVARPERGFAVRPRWSPDGTRLTFTARRGIEAVVYVADVDSSQLKRVNPPGTSGRYGNFTPDGKAMTYSEEGPNGWRVVLKPLLDDGPPMPYPGTEGGSDPLLSADGRSIYYTKVSEEGLFRYDVETRAETLLTRRIGFRNMDSWIVDGETVLFSDTDADGRLGVYRMPLDGRGEPKLARYLFGTVGGFELSLSRDRSRLILAERGRSDSDVVLGELE